MGRLKYTIQARVGQIHASTLFAVILAIVAGLIFAWVFKMVFLNSKPKPVAIAPTRKLTVAAINLLDRMLIQTGQVKTITISEDEYNVVVNDPRFRSRNMLSGSQPINRTTLKPIRAEEPIFEDELEPLQYPESISARLGEGKRAVHMDVPSNLATLQVGDRVDVICTIANDNWALGGNGTLSAPLAKGVRIIARFNTTRTAAQPPAGANRPYTLETTPYRAALINLARSLGGSFTLLVSPRQTGEDNIAATDTSLDDPQTDRVTAEDLARVFGITPAVPPTIFQVERFNGVRRTDTWSFPGYSNSSTAATGPVSTNPQVAPAGASKGRNPAAPAAGTPTSSNRSLPMPADRSTAALGSASGTYGMQNNFGFRPAGPQNKGCPTCGQK